VRGFSPVHDPEGSCYKRRVCLAMTEGGVPGNDENGMPGNDKRGVPGDDEDV